MRARPSVIQKVHGYPTIRKEKGGEALPDRYRGSDRDAR